MPEFKCCVCEKIFSVPEAALEKYPNWKPKYCKKHSPRKKKDDGGNSITGELDLAPAEVLERFHDGPDSGVFTDGGARPNPGPGGWGIVYVKAGKIIKELHGYSEDTTNNRMELTALIEGYKLLPVDAEFTVYSDSELCVKTINIWAPSWEKRGWKRKTGPIKNLDLIQELYTLHLKRLNVKLEWIKAHNGWRWNEYADALATMWVNSKND